MAAGKRYSAGAIFLQVVPVFGNIQRAIEDEAKNIDRSLGDQMERSGEKAGQRAGRAASKAMKDEVDKGSRDLSGSFERDFHKSVDEINKALGGIETKRLSNSLRRELTEMKKEISGLKDIDITAEANFQRAYADIAVLEGRLRGFRDDVKIIFRSDVDAALKGFGKVAAAKERIEDPVEIEVSADFKVAERQMSAFEKRFKKVASTAAGHFSGEMKKEIKDVGDNLRALENLDIGVHISSARARAELKEIASDIKRLQADELDIDAKIALAGAMAELAAFEAALAKIDERDIDINVKTDSLRKARSHADDAANSFRSFNIILFAVVGAGPALVPVLAAIAGGLLAIGPAAAVAAFGLGSVLVGFSGLGDAVSALQSQQEQAATNAQTNAGRQEAAADRIRNAQEALSDAQRNAARAAEDAADRVADAREASADAIEDALKRQKRAQEEYRDAVQEVKDAEQDLREAREDARKDAETLAKRQRQNAVDERQAVLDLFEAQSEFNAVMADGSSTDTDKEQASVNLEQAQIALNNTRDEQVALAEEAADYAANGVDGSEKVQNAQDAVTAALEAQKEAQEAVKEAARDADEARRDGAERVTEALEDQREVLSDNARAIQRAKENLSDARRQAVDDLSQINAQQQAVNAAFDKLGPAGRKFALFLFSLRDGFYEFRDAVQSAMLPAIQEAIEGFIGSSSAGKARDALVILAAAFGDFVKALSQSFQGPAWSAFFEMLAEYGPRISEAYGGAFISIMEAFASILVTAAPFALRFAEGLAAMMDSFADWAASKAGQEEILDFLGYVRRVGPKVIDFFGDFAGAVVDVLKALAPYGEVVLNLLDNFFEFISSLDPQTLGAIATALTILLLSSQVVYAIQNLAKAGAAIFATSLGPWAFLIIGIGAALTYLYHVNEDFRDFIDDAWDDISKVLKNSWEEVIKPALDDLMDAFKELWQDVLQPFLEWLGPILLWMIEHLIPLFAKIWETKIRFITSFIRGFINVVRLMTNVIKWTWEKVIKPVWDKMAAAGKWLWNNVLKPAFNGIKDGWDSVKDKIVGAWRDHIKPIWDTIKDTALPALQAAFQSTVDAIGGIWDTLKAMVAKPIKFVIEKIINGGLIAGYNKVADWVNAPNIDPVPIPESLQSYATGGVLPGYTPGRDPHKFVSPTGGRLELSGGEAIMRPEFTAAVGPSFVHAMNSLAMSGGVSAVRKAMGYATGGIVQAFAKGGIVFPVHGGYVERTPYNLNHDGMDINHPNDASGLVPFVSATSGRVTTTGYSRGYGNAVFVASPYGELVYGHAADGTVRVSPGQIVSPGQWLANIGDTGNSSGPHLHFGIPGSQGGTFARAAEILAGAAPASAIIAGDPTAKDRRLIPPWLMSIVKDPLGAFKGWITDPLEKATDSIKSPLFDAVAKLPLTLGKKAVDKVWDVIPGWVKTSAGWAGEGASWVIGGLDNAYDATFDAVGDAASGVKSGAGAVADWLGFADGGILPYNGTMMYDSGGYLPPGVTTVMNLTGKPEPVFTADQFDDLGVADGEGFTYAPTFQGSNLTPADVVDDFDFTRRKIRREGRYQRSMP